MTNAFRLGLVPWNESHFPQIHRYVALAHAAKGDHAEALKTIKQAILYEAKTCCAVILSFIIN